MLVENSKCRMFSPALSPQLLQLANRLHGHHGNRYAKCRHNGQKGMERERQKINVIVYLLNALLADDN